MLNFTVQNFQPMAIGNGIAIFVIYLLFRLWADGKPRSLFCYDGWFERVIFGLGFGFAIGVLWPFVWVLIISLIGSAIIMFCLGLFFWGLDWLARQSSKLKQRFTRA